MRIFFCILLNLLLCFSGSIRADEPEASDLVLLRSGEVYEGDYFAWASGVEISGTINGDAYLFATQAIIDGTIMGDLIVIGGSVEVSGVVQGNIRVLAGQVTLSGPVGRNATVLAANVQLPSSSKLQGNLVIAAGNADVGADVGGTVNAAVSNLRLSGHIQKNVSAYVGEMRVTSKAIIGGALDYRSHSTASIDPQAKINGPISYHPSLLHSVVDLPWLRGIIIGSKIAGLLMNFLYTFVVGWILIRMFPRKLEITLDVLKDKPLQSLGFGLVLLVVLPLVSLVLLMTVLGAPFALTLIALNIIGFYTAKVFSILAASNWLFSKWGFKENKIPTLAMGQVVYYLLITIPIFGSLLAFVSMLFGLGAIAIAQTKKHTFLRQF